MSEAELEMVCDELVGLVTEYLEGTISEVDRERFETHVRECEWCEHYVEQTRAVVVALGALGGEPPDPRRVEPRSDRIPRRPRKRRVKMGASMEHDRAVADARAHLAGKAGPPLETLPPGFAATRSALHRVAEDVLKPKRELETGNEIALGFSPGGFGSPPWEKGKASGESGRIRVEGVEIVTAEGDDESRRAADDVDPAGAAALADWFAFGTVVLAELLTRHPDLDPAPIRLWPEHFDVATELGAEAMAGARTTAPRPGTKITRSRTSTWGHGISR